MRTPSPPRPARRRLAVGALATLPLLLTSCAGGASAEAPALLRTSAGTLADVGSARFTLTNSTTLAGEPLSIAGTGAVDVAAGVSALTVQLPNGKVEQRTVDGTVYVALPQAPKVFYAIDVDEVRGTLLGVTDPTAATAALAAVKDVEEAGQEQVRGERTTRYDGVLDVARVLEGARGPARELAQATLGRSGQSEVPFSAWLDEDGQLRRYRQQVSVPAGQATGGKELETTTTLELFDFGVEVVVEAPPAGSVQDGGPLLESLLGGGAGAGS